jgi:polyisoprenoid-binding protein YceI
VRAAIRSARTIPLLTLSLAIIAASAPVSRAQARDWIVRTGEIRVVCPLTVGGSFEAKSTAITGTWRPADDSAAGVGQLVVDLATLDTGIQLRNEHLRDVYLEVGKGEGYARAVLSQIRVDGIDAQSLSGRGTFSATLLLHGQSLPVTGRADLKRNGDAVDVRAEFPVGLPKYGIAKPRYLGVGVKDEVTVRVTFSATRQ